MIATAPGASWGAPEGSWVPLGPLGVIGRNWAKTYENYMNNRSFNYQKRPLKQGFRGPDPRQMIGDILLNISQLSLLIRWIQLILGVSWSHPWGILGSCLSSWGSLAHLLFHQGSPWLIRGGPGLILGARGPIPGQRLSSFVICLISCHIFYQGHFTQTVVCVTLPRGRRFI